ncbi:GNAT family N-acetyltransferase [Pseudalkalibacillus sp. Hm43]|uniref:GNAT family N-acetyltransferase n=1 Tax=Pseudalkalibacillus sp. Hm43 TaxID=3450742 RepID=UPI003F42149E
MKLLKTAELPKEIRTTFFREHWGSPEMVISSGTYRCDELDGFAVLNREGNILGMITYVSQNDFLEIMSLDSLKENRGIGSMLMEVVERVAVELGVSTIRLITTNDNLNALKFYQKRGYHLVEVFPGAVERARTMKPEIPLIADNGIPIRDELLLVKNMTGH